MKSMLSREQIVRHLHLFAWAYATADKMPSCYLAGPMTGLPDFNVHSFIKGSELLRDAGWTVFSPHENDEEAGIVLEGQDGTEDFDFATAMARDLQQVCTVDAVFVMPGWEESTGGQLEVYVAHKVGKPVYTLLSQRKIEENSLESTTPLGQGTVTSGQSDMPTDGEADAAKSRVAPVAADSRRFGSSQEASLTSSQSANEGADRAGSAPSPWPWESGRIIDIERPKLHRHPNSARFHQLVEEIANLHDLKQQDYGSESDPFANVRASEDWGVPAWVGALVRLNDKVTRLKSFARKGMLANESAEDSMMDIAVYALIALVLYEQDSA